MATPICFARLFQRQAKVWLVIHSMDSGKRDGQGSNVQAWSGKLKLVPKAIGLLPSPMVGGLEERATIEMLGPFGGC